jgi:general secretion pathway protein D
MNFSHRHNRMSITTAHRGCLRLWLLAMVFALWVFGPISAQAADASITFNLKDADLETVIATVAEVTGKNFIIDPRVKGKVTVISSKPMSADEVYQTFLSLLEVHSFAAVPMGNVIKIVPAVNAKQIGGSEMLKKNARGDEIVTRVIDVKNVSAAQLVPILRPLVPQEGHMAAYAPTNVLIVSDSAANVDRLLSIIDRIDIASASDLEVISLQYASATEVVRILESLRQQGKRADPNQAAGGAVLVADERTNSILISGDKTERLNIRAIITHLDTPLETTGNTIVIYLKYAKAKDLVPVLTGLSESFQKEKQGAGKAAAAAPQNRSPITIQADESTNALVITAPQDLQRSMKSVIQQLDIRRAQVMVEAVIAEVQASRMAELGIQWLFDGTPGGNGPVGGTNFGSSNIISVGTALQAGTPPPISPGVFLGLGRFNSSNINFAALVNALEGDGDTNVLSKPNIVTLDNEEAEIVVGQNVPFLTGSYTSTGTGTSTPSNPFTTIQRENVGITLKVKPQINEGDAVKLDIEQKVDSIAASTAGAADLITNTRSIKTSVMVDDGGSVVLGGLIKDDLRETEQRVPILGEIPFLGALFRYKKTEKEKTNLMVFLHPVIMRDAAITTRMTASKYDYIRTEQLSQRKAGVSFMNDKVAPVLPTFPEFMELPPAYEAPVKTPPAESTSDQKNGDGQ